MAGLRGCCRFSLRVAGSSCVTGTTRLNLTWEAIHLVAEFSARFRVAEDAPADSRRIALFFHLLQQAFGGKVVGRLSLPLNQYPLVPSRGLNSTQKKRPSPL
jgi:hypothetical protein